jgi:hypothetical protein
MIFFFFFVVVFVLFLLNQLNLKTSFNQQNPVSLINVNPPLATSDDRQGKAFELARDIMVSSGL